MSFQGKLISVVSIKIEPASLLQKQFSKSERQISVRLCEVNLNIFCLWVGVKR